MTDEFPTQDMEITTLLVVSDIKKSTEFYQNVMGAEFIREYGGTSSVFKLMGHWLLLVTGGEPTKDKPTISFNPPQDPNNVSREFTIKVPDCKKAYEILKSRGAEFLTEPVNWEYEIRAFFRDPDGHLIEISETVKK